MNEVRERFPDFFTGEFGTVVLPRSKLDELGISKKNRALACCNCGEDYQTRLGIVAEVYNPRSKRLMVLSVDAPSVRGSGNYTHGWARNGCELVRRPRSNVGVRLKHQVMSSRCICVSWSSLGRATSLGIRQIQTLSGNGEDISKIY